MNKLTLTTGFPNPAFLGFPSNGGRLLLWRFSFSSLPSSSSSSSQSSPPALTGFDGVVQEQGNRMRLDSWLSLQLPDHISRARVQNSIRSGLAYVNDQSVNKVSYSVRTGDHVKCAIAALVPLKADPENIPLNIVFEDDYVIVVNKPADMVTHPAPGNWNGTLVNALLHHCDLPVMKNLSKQLDGEVPTGNFQDESDSSDDEEVEGLEHLDPLAGINEGPSLAVRPGIVHRLDKGTSGLLVIAKDEHAHEHLSKQFKDRSIKRSYLSLTCGVPSNKEGCVDAAIGRDVNNRTRMSVIKNNSTNRKSRVAISNYKVIQVLANGGSALVEWRLQTGRTHQIRVHAQHLGHPLIGDELYGGTKGAALSSILPKISSSNHGNIRKLMGDLQRPYLHATSLGFVHPRSCKELHFMCPLPADFEDLWVKLQKIQ